MKASIHRSVTALAAAAALLLTTACVAPLAKPEGAAAVRTKLSQLQADPQLASRAPAAIKDAEVAVTAAEVPRDDAAFARHLVIVADRKVDTAWAQAQGRLSEDQRQSILDQGERARLDSRTREADNARSDAASARSEAASARGDAAIARSEAELARLESSAAKQQSADLRQQLAELNAKETERGLVITLGDVLFASGGYAFKGGTAGNLGRLATFLNKYPDRTVQIEGHTDSVGNTDANLTLSQRRAEAVKAYLVQQGVDASRIAASGMGEGSPAAGNDSATGRQQNRRVEVIIPNTGS